MVELDPITLEVLWNRLVAIADEQAQTLIRTSFSTVIREAEDLSSAIFDRDGNMLAQALTGTPGHVNSLAIAVKHILKKFPLDAYEPGDVIITNDPWITTGHKNDITVATPVFYRGRVEAVCASTGHMPDIGGRIYSADTREIYEEGLGIPIMKLYRAGRPSEDLFTLIAENVRMHEQVIGDINALVTANSVGGAKLGAFLDEFQLGDLTDLSRAILTKSEQAVRRAIEAIPDGVYPYEMWIDGFDAPIKFVLKLTVQGSEVVMDYTGTSPQTHRGINVPWNYTNAYSCFALKAAAYPELPNNDGAFRPVRVIAPEGCILNAKFPAPVSGRHLTGHLLASPVFGALAQAIPHRVVADYATPSVIQLSGVNQRGAHYAFIYLFGGGIGARPHSDGPSTMFFPGNCSNTPLEIVEGTSPVFFLRKELIEDSGGPGRFRGGCGQRLQFKVRSDQPTVFSCMFERVIFPAQGFLGGGAGKPTVITKNEDEKPHPKQHCIIEPGEIVTIDVAGGGGFHDPFTRDPQKVLQDVINHKVSLYSAERHYGVGINRETWTVDVERTKQLRAAARTSAVAI